MALWTPSSRAGQVDLLAPVALLFLSLLVASCRSGVSMALWTPSSRAGQVDLLAPVALLFLSLLVALPFCVVQGASPSFGHALFSRSDLWLALVFDHACLWRGTDVAVASVPVCRALVGVSTTLVLAA